MRKLMDHAMLAQSFVKLALQAAQIVYNATLQESIRIINAIVLQDLCLKLTELVLNVILHVHHVKVLILINVYLAILISTICVVLNNV